MNRQDEIRLRDMRDEARQTLDFMEGNTRQSLDDNKMLAYAVIRTLEIIGEAASKVSAETRAVYPQMKWRSIVGMRNRIIHDYSNVDLDIVWETITIQIPELIAELDRILPSEDAENE
jgi:uncharacterized protein with HEPN domain